MSLRRVEVKIKASILDEFFSMKGKKTWYRLSPVAENISSCLTTVKKRAAVDSYLAIERMGKCAAANSCSVNEHMEMAPAILT